MNPEAFLARWQQPITKGAQLTFEHQSLSNNSAPNHCNIGDEIAISAGYKPIGFNWELLDPFGSLEESRSVLATMVRACAHDMEFPKQEWLGKKGAIGLAQDFMALFEAPRTIITNRLEEYWNPLTDARIEWAFVGFDETQACLMILTRA